jgi:AraC family transcriptional regulator
MQAVGFDGESAIPLLDLSSGGRVAAASAGAVILSSARVGWRSPLVFEVHRMADAAYAEHRLVDHRLIVNLGAPLRFGWHAGDRRREEVLPTGGLCLQSDGETNAPFWRGEMTFAAVALPPAMVEALLEDRAPAPGETFEERRCLSDAGAHGLARALAAELASPGEPLLAETLAQAFALHLVSAHGRARGAKRLAPRGKLGAAGLRRVAEHARENLAGGLDLAGMAAVAGYSPFQFARMFKATTGLAPHQYVLRLRVERACRLIRGGAQDLAEVALAAGFYDQAHLTNVFRKTLGVTPAAWAASA